MKTQTLQCLHTEAALSQKSVHVSTVQRKKIKSVLSSIVGARLPLAGQEVFGFEVEHVSVRLSLLAMAVHVFLGVLHHLLCLLCHLRNKIKKKI